MTTLALLTLNPRSKLARASFRDPQTVHKTLMRCFESDLGCEARKRVGLLWRIEPGDAPTILMQSEAEPEFAALPDDYADIRQRPLGEHIESLHDGLTVNFRVVLNPARNSRTGGVNRRIVIPAKDRPQWAAERVANVGLDAVSVPTITGMADRHVKRGEKRVPVYSVRVDGVARVSDVEHLRAAIRGGIGHAKAWGCGLLTVLRA
ncbi:MAG: type I-E CRISPR-associated protein Cas6/Cse3/CasE [Acidimicrobiales bacterium]|nr:type I-E CRISPR-associated protein Cas6/Cse3/CasE [Acidimicrobiales bacterium]MYA38873.1 type I-E CRISPR-associated protein Cas6/Cse3/CasE [Acidimicrobiia bacterium]MYB82809.1 type I-E CRISPR-associated protein Cas6/Cse3/CasE [Acidimicrobiales bacterium]MYI12090.1 type I-E CRISPR-associated protein Cas6/Cse3/CasE [Acidimicrobiales bacterium]MYK55310.1 type I-E CRISPR-associated protein Cas6/Cse3/CasE [Acidimicrobiia bacterium]